MGSAAAMVRIPTSGRTLVKSIVGRQTNESLSRGTKSCSTRERACRIQRCTLQDSLARVYILLCPWISNTTRINAEQVFLRLQRTCNIRSRYESVHSGNSGREAHTQGQSRFARAATSPVVRTPSLCATFSWPKKIKQTKKFGATARMVPKSGGAAVRSR